MPTPQIGIKICGLQPGDDLSFSQHVSVRYVGIIFVPRSRRFVNPDVASTIVNAVDSSASVIGVFANEPYDSLMRSATTAGVQGVQLHGDESPELCALLRNQGLQVWKALAAPTTPADIPAYCNRVMSFAGEVDAILLDAPPPQHAEAGVNGGYGASFDWTILPQVSNEMQRLGQVPELWIAGGLSVTNVPLLFEHFRPVGVDVSSGVEEQGRKRIEKINDFIKAVVGHGGTWDVS